jgi:hypothetical protein
VPHAAVMDRVRRLCRAIVDFHPTVSQHIVRWASAALGGLCCLVPAAGLAQGIEPVVTAPPNLVLANYDSVPVGPFGGLEGSAFGARISDPAAAWFNPAGLSRESTGQISGSAGIYQRTSVSPQALTSAGGSLQQLPSLVGLTVNLGEGLTAGGVILTTTAWMQETDSELISSSGGVSERFAYSADSDFTRQIVALGVGYTGGEGWRVGGGLAFSLMDVRLVQTSSDRIADHSSLRTLLVASRASGNAVQLRSQFGAQYDHKRLRLGAAVRTPGVSLWRDGLVTLDGTLDAGAGTLGASLFGDDAELQYKLPWEFQTGAAYVHDRVELEVDIQAYSAIGAYSLLSTDKPTIIYGDAGPDTPPTIVTRPFPGLTTASDAVVNVALGGHVRPIASRDLRIHGGLATSDSPVGAADNVFTKADQTSWTLGASGTFGRLQFSVGVNRRFGTAYDVEVRNLLNGRRVESDVDIRSTGFIYSVAYQF